MLIDTNRTIWQPATADKSFIDRWLAPKHLAMIFLGLVALYLIVQLNSHFWLDETVTYWVTNAGIGEIVKRCNVLPQSILYSFLFYQIRSLGATQPWLYRLPSLFGVAGATFLLFRLTRRLFTAEVAWLAIALFVSLQPVQFAADDARPYGLGLFFAVLSTDLLLRLIDRPSYGIAVLYGVAAGVTLHFHLLFGTILVVHFLYLLACLWAGRQIPRLQLIVATLTFIGLILPLVPQYSVTSRNAAAHSFTPPPELGDLVATFFPNSAAIALVAAGIVLMMMAHRTILSFSADRLSRSLVLLWAVMPPLLLFAASKVSNAHVFVPRYLLLLSPGLAICLAALIGSVDSFRLISRCAVCILILLALLPFKHPSQIRHAHFLGDWAEAMAFVDRETAADHAPVLFRSQFPESDVMPLEPVQDNPILAQLTFYPAKSLPQIVAVSRNFGNQKRLDDFLATKLTSFNRFLFVFHGRLSAADPYIYYLKGRLWPQWQMRLAGDFDGVTVTEFQRVQGVKADHVAP